MRITLPIIFHELIPFFGSPRGTNHKYGFLVTSGCLLSRKVWWVTRIGSFCPKLRYFTDQNRPKGWQHENEFWPFWNIKVNVRNSYSRKCRWKNGVICLVSMLPSWVAVLKLSKKVHFLQFSANLSQKPKSINAIYIYGSESSHYSLSENDMVYRGLSHRSWDISD